MSGSDDNEATASDVAMQIDDEAPWEVQQSKEFHRLKEALEWANEHLCQGPPGCAEEDKQLCAMLVIVKQTPYLDRQSNTIKSQRRFLAIRADLLEKLYRSYRGGDGKRHLDEVIPENAPCKFAIDCDWKVEKLGLAGRASEADLFRDLDASFAALVPRIVALIEERHGVRTEPCITAACRAGKWSKHAVFDGAVWKSQRHCRALALELTDADVARCGGDKERSLIYLYVDPNIYDTNHSLRMYRSSKVDEPTRAFRRAGETAESPLDVEFLRKTTITLFQVRGVDDQSYWVTSLLARRFGASLRLEPLEHPRAHDAERSSTVLRSRALPTRATAVGGGDWTRAFVQSFVSYGAYQADAALELGRLRLRCLNHMCAIKGAPHTNENIFIQIDLFECVWRQNCFNAVCRRTPTAWEVLPDELVNLCDQVYREWSGRESAGAWAVHAKRLANF